MCYAFGVRRQESVLEVLSVDSKLIGISEAVAKLINEGDLVCFGGFTHGIPFAMAHEIIRQRKRGLVVCKETPDLVVDQLISAGCVKKIIFSWGGNPGVGSIHGFRRAIEKGIPHPIEFEEYTHFIMASMFFGGACGLTFMPMTSSVLASDLARYTKKLKFIDCPFTGKKTCLVPSMNPDVAVIHAQRADTEGNVQMWGIIGSNREIAMASKRVIVSVEEIVKDEVTRRDPNRTIISGFHVDAIVEEPWGAHPSYTQGYYDRDNEYYIEYEKQTRTLEGTEAFLQEWVYTVQNRREYLKKLGAEKTEKLKIKPQLSSPVDYGYYG